MQHIVYLTANTVTGKFYLGVHSTEDLNDTYLGSGKLLGKAIKKYGEAAFRREILFIFPTAEEAYQKEAELVTEDVVRCSSSYNLKPGGQGGFSEDARAKQAARGQDWLKGKTYEEIFGKEKANELKQHRRQTSGWVGADHSGDQNANFGNRWSDEKKAEFASRRQKENHPGFGSFWVTNGDQSVKLKPGDPIPEGFWKGRKVKRTQAP